MSSLYSRWADSQETAATQEAKAASPPPFEPVELVIDPKTGEARQAGADPGRSDFALAIRALCERSLFSFARIVMGRTYLTYSLHRPVCDWLQTCPPRRKLLLWPREHGKSSIVAHCLPLHILIQPTEGNLYFPGQPGNHQRIILCSWSDSLLTDHMKVIMETLSGNPIFRAFWPHRTWDDPRRQTRAGQKRWNWQALDIPGDHGYPDPSIRTKTVGSGMAGAHPSALIKDDVIERPHADSAIEMESAIAWHKASRNTINKPSALEFTIGTHWAPGDLYFWMKENDPTIATVERGCIENGVPIYPEEFTLDALLAKRELDPQMFSLQMMNNVAAEGLADFTISDLRRATLSGPPSAQILSWPSDPRDLDLATAYSASPPTPRLPAAGLSLNEAARRGYLRRTTRDDPDDPDEGLPPGLLPRVHLARNRAR